VPILRDELDRRILRLAVPALGTLAIEPVYVLVDTAIVGRLGAEQLAGLAIASTILLTVVSLMTFLEYGITPAVAFAHGAGDPDAAHRRAGDALWLTVLIGVPMAAVLAALARPLAHLIGGRGEVLAHATTYLRISAVGVPFILVAYVGHGVMRGINDLRRPMQIVIIANVVNVIVEIVTVYGFHLGVAGSAWSTVVVQIGAAGAFVVMLRPHTAWVAPLWSRLRPMLVTGVHLAIRSLAMFTVWNAATAVAARIDTPTLAAHQVLTTLFMFLALCLDALAIPAQSLVAGARGSGDIEEALRVGWASNRLSLWCAGVIAAVLAACSPLLPYVFSNDGDVRSRLTAGLLLLAVMQFPGAVAFALDGALIGASDERFLGRQAIVNLIGFAPLAIATAVWPRLGLAGLWGAQLMWMTMRAVVNWRRFASRRWVGAVGD
jgi:putative MATE family efflux protein